MRINEIIRLPCIKEDTRFIYRRFRSERGGGPRNEEVEGE